VRVYRDWRHVGYFDDEVEGARAYDATARFYFGHAAQLNFPEAEPLQESDDQKMPESEVGAVICLPRHDKEIVRC
jgi:hypothetical protein